MWCGWGGRGLNRKPYASPASPDPLNLIVSATQAVVINLELARCLENSGRFRRSAPGITVRQGNSGETSYRLEFFSVAIMHVLLYPQIALPNAHTDLNRRSRLGCSLMSLRCALTSH